MIHSDKENNSGTEVNNRRNQYRRKTSVHQGKKLKVKQFIYSASLRNHF
jgi:hypothetical protein